MTIKTPAQIIAEITSLYPDNTSGLITPSLVRQVSTDQAQSYTPYLKVTQVLMSPGPYTAQPTDEVLIVKQTIGAPFTVNVDWSARSIPLRVVDGKGDAATNKITITPANGQTQLAILNYSCVIDSNGASITLTPLPDNSGAY